MKLEKTGMHIMLFPGCVTVWGAIRFVSFSGKTEKTNSLSEKRKWVLMEGGKAQAQRSWGVSLAFLELCRSCLWLQFGALMFKPSVNKCISSIGGSVSSSRCFSRIQSVYSCRNSQPSSCPGEFTCTKCFSHKCFPGLLLREWHRTVAELPSRKFILLFLIY